MRPQHLTTRHLTVVREGFHYVAGRLRTGLSRCETSPHSVVRDKAESAGGTGGTAIAVLPDPHRGVDLVVVSGPVTASTSLDLEATCRGLEGDGIHLDLHDAVIADVAAMSLLELVIDRIEARGIQVRVRGIDPTHPALAT